MFTILASINWYFQGQENCSAHGVSEVLKVNGCIYIAINSLCKELPQCCTVPVRQPSQGRAQSLKERGEMPDKS